MAATLQAVVALDSSTFDAGLGALQRTVANAAAALSSAFGGVAGEIMAMAAAFGPVGAAVGILQPVIDVGRKFETAMVDLAAATGMTGDEVTRLGTRMVEAGADMGYSAGDVTGALAELAESGTKTAADLEAQLLPAMDLARVAGVEVKDSVAAVDAAMDAWGLTADKTADVANLYAAAMQASGLSVADLGESIATVGPMAKALGLSLEETTAAITAMESAGYSGAAAGASFKAALGAIHELSEKGKGPVAAALKGWRSESEGLAGALKRLERGGFSAGDMMDAFGKKAGPAVAALLNIGTEGLQKYGDAVAKAGALAEAAAAKKATLAVQAGILTANFQALALNIFQAVQPALAAVIRLTNRVVEGVADMVKALVAGDIPAALAVVQAGILAVWAALANAPWRRIFKTIMDALDKIFADAGKWVTNNAAFLLFGGLGVRLAAALAAAFAGLPVVAVAGVAAAIALAANVDWSKAFENIAAGFVKAWGPVRHEIRKAIMAARWEFDHTDWGEAWDSFVARSREKLAAVDWAGLWAGFKNAFIVTVNTFNKILEDFFAWINTAFDGKSSEEIWAGMKRGAQAAWTEIREIALAIWPGIEARFLEGFKIIGNLARGVWAGIRDELGPVLEGVAESLAGAMGEITVSMEQTRDELAAGWTATLEYMRGEFAGLLAGIKNLAESVNWADVFGAMGDAAVATAKTLEAVMASTFTYLGDELRRVTDDPTIWENFTAGLSRASDTFADVWDGAIARVEEAFTGIEWQQMTFAAGKAAGEMVALMVKAVREFSAWLAGPEGVELLGRVLEAVTEGIVVGVKAAFEALTAIVDGFLTGLLGDKWGKVKDVFAGIADAVGRLGSAIERAMTWLDKFSFNLGDIKLPGWFKRIFGAGAPTVTATAELETNGLGQESTLARLLGSVNSMRGVIWSPA